MKVTRLAYTLLVIAFALNSVRAENQSLPPINAAPDIGLGGLIVRLLFYFILLCGCCYILVRFSKRGLLKPFSFTPGESSLKIVETKRLGNRQFLTVVAYESHKILLSVGPNGMQYLCSLNIPDKGKPSDKINCASREIER
jgi:flagellar biogenesis protein FliO